MRSGPKQAEAARSGARRCSAARCGAAAAARRARQSESIAAKRAIRLGAHAVRGANRAWG
ncbi:hypothetical protein AQ725_12920 [Burkholderia pseudomallei]|nr:hypothetical protein AQ725_12920 [Burkholderia pseudomallei]